jgi:hypothetical protein
LLGGRSIELALPSSAHRAFGKQPSPMIAELFRADSALRESVHLPWLAQEAASARRLFGRLRL